MKIKIGNKLVGNGEPTFIIAEMGINHNGDIDLAKKMVDVAVECGADAVKTQKRNVKEVFTQDVLNAPRDGGIYYDYKEGIELSNEEFRALAKYCDDKGIIFLASPFDIGSADIVNEVVPAHKIASPLLTDMPLVEHIAKMGKPVILSTGMSSIAEIEDIINLIRIYTHEIILLHCTSTYPTEPRQANLRVMKTLRDRFSLPVGFSSHERGIWMSEAAVALGAVVVERHFTLDRTMPGSDQAVSLEPEGLKKLIRNIRAIEVAMGSPEKSILNEEWEPRRQLSKSVVAKQDIKAGQVLSEEMLTTKSPGTGLSPRFMFTLVGTKVREDLKKDDFVMLEDVE